MNRSHAIKLFAAGAVIIFAARGIPAYAAQATPPARVLEKNDRKKPGQKKPFDTILAMGEILPATFGKFTGGQPAILPPQDTPSADGLRNMRERLEEMGGRCQIQSRAGAGTIIAIELPWPPS